MGGKLRDDIEEYLHRYEKDFKSTKTGLRLFEKKKEKNSQKVKPDSSKLAGGEVSGQDLGMARMILLQLIVKST